MVKDRLMTAGEVAAYLNCSVSTVRRLALRGRIPHYRLGKMVRFRRPEVDAWLAGHQKGEDPAQEKVPQRVLGQLSLFD